MVEKNISILGKGKHFSVFHAHISFGAYPTLHKGGNGGFIPRG